MQTPMLVALQDVGYCLRRAKIIIRVLGILDKSMFLKVATIFNCDLGTNTARSSLDSSMPTM